MEGRQRENIANREEKEEKRDAQKRRKRGKGSENFVVIL